MTRQPRLEVPEPNTITRPYRGLSVQEVDTPLTQAGIERLLSRRDGVLAYVVRGRFEHARASQTRRAR